MDTTPRVVLLKEVVDSAGHLSAKWAYLNGENEVWLDYDTRTATEDPPHGEILVFDSVTGVYDRYTTLAEARARFEEHFKRLTRLVEANPIPRTQPIRLPDYWENTKEPAGLIVL